MRLGVAAMLLEIVVLAAGYTLLFVAPAATVGALLTMLSLAALAATILVDHLIQHNGRIVLPSKRGLATYGIILLFGMTLVLAFLWWTAFLAGGRAVIAVNSVGEADIEAVLWVVVLPLGGWSVREIMRQDTHPDTEVTNT